MIGTQNAGRICLQLEGLQDTTKVSSQKKEKGGRHGCEMGRGSERNETEFESYNLKLDRTLKII